MAFQLQEGAAHNRTRLARYIQDDWFELDVPESERTGYGLRAGEDYPADVEPAKIRAAIRNYGRKRKLDVSTFLLEGVDASEGFGVICTGTFNGDSAAE